MCYHTTMVLKQQSSEGSDQPRSNEHQLCIHPARLPGYFQVERNAIKTALKIQISSGLWCLSIRVCAYTNMGLHHWPPTDQIAQNVTSLAQLATIALADNRKSGGDSLFPEVSFAPYAERDAVKGTDIRGFA
jgi:hypothetical protein